MKFYIRNSQEKFIFSNFCAEILSFRSVLVYLLYYIFDDFRHQTHYLADYLFILDENVYNLKVVRKLYALTCRS